MSITKVFLFTKDTDASATEQGFNGYLPDIELTTHDLPAEGTQFSLHRICHPPE